MSVINILRSIYGRFDRKKTYHFSHSRAEDEAYINTFIEPVDDIDRSFNQYLCQKWNDNSPIRYFLINVVAAVLILPYSFNYRKKSKKVEAKKHYDAVLARDFIESLLPDDFKGSYIYQEFNKGFLAKEDSLFISDLWKKHPMSFYFVFKCMCRVASYSDFIKNFTPNIVYSSAEYSFTSSILTNYCEKHNIDHVNIMHGEKLYTTREAFSRFTRFYVWDDFYIELFISMRADKTKYLISPMRVPDVDVKKSTNSCVYYLQLQTKEQLIKIKEAMEKLGVKYKLRPHPVYDTSATKEVFGEARIENSKSVDIWTSIANAGIVVSVYSTVLYQAYLKNVTIMIDDISNPELYRQLAERDYIMVNKPHLLLSEELKMRN